MKSNTCWHASRFKLSICRPPDNVNPGGKGSRKLETFDPGYAGLDHPALLASVAEWVGIASRVLCGEKVLTENVKTPILQFNLNS